MPLHFSASHFKNQHTNAPSVFCWRHCTVTCNVPQEKFLSAVPTRKIFLPSLSPQELKCPSGLCSKTNEQRTSKHSVYPERRSLSIIRCVSLHAIPSVLWWGCCALPLGIRFKLHLCVFLYLRGWKAKNGRFPCCWDSRFKLVSTIRGIKAIFGGGCEGSLSFCCAGCCWRPVWFWVWMFLQLWLYLQPLTPWMSWHVGGVAMLSWPWNWSCGVFFISTFPCVGLSFSAILIMAEVAASLVGQLGCRALISISDSPA